MQLGLVLRRVSITAKFDFQQCGILTSVGSGEHVLPLFRLRNPNDL